MPDLATRFGGPSLDVASVPASSRGILIASDASAHTKNATWTELIASTTAPSSWVLVNLYAESDYNLVDIGIGASTAEQAVIPNLYAASPTVVSPLAAVYLLPFAIPAGTRLSARSQSRAGPDNTNVNVLLFGPTLDSPVPLTRVEACGVVTASTALTSIDPGGVAHTDSGWVELIASTSFAYRWMLFAAAYQFDFSATASRILVDLAVGGSGAEAAFINDISLRVETGIDTPSPQSLSFPVNIPAGTRISAQARSSLTTVDERLVQVAVWGVG